MVITKTCPYYIQYFFFRSKIDNFQLKKINIFLVFAQNIDCGYALEPPRRGGSNEYPQSMFWSKIRKIGLPLHTPVLLYKSGVQGGYTLHGHVFLMLLRLAHAALSLISKIWPALYSRSNIRALTIWRRLRYADNVGFVPKSPRRHL